MTEPADDGELLRAFLAGDAAAFSRLWARHASALRRFLRSSFGSGVASDDVLQETFLSLARNAEGIRDASSVRYYLLSAVRRQALLERRRMRQRERWEPLSAGEVAAAPPLDAAARDTLKKALVLLGRLSERRRAAFILCCVEQRSVEEAAAELGVSRATVGREVRAARGWIRRSGLSRSRNPDSCHVG